jgi:L-ribulose-5-phosphate 4-epimerase
MAVPPKKDIQEASKAFRWASQRAFQMGLQGSTGGNISIRVGPGQFLTKPTGVGLLECRESDLVLVDSQARPFKDHAKPTKELHVHLAIFETRSDIGGIVHYHAPYATAYAVRGLPLPLPTVHAKRILKQVPLIGAYPEGSPELAAAVAQTFKAKEMIGILMANHGLIAIGSTLTQAQYMAELMEESARITWLSQQIK